MNARLKVITILASAALAAATFGGVAGASADDGKSSPVLFAADAGPVHPRIKPPPPKLPPDPPSLSAGPQDPVADEAPSSTELDYPTAELDIPDPEAPILEPAPVGPPTSHGPTPGDPAVGGDSTSDPAGDLAPNVDEPVAPPSLGPVDCQPIDLPMPG